jgi:hypothetical protein
MSIDRKARVATLGLLLPLLLGGCSGGDKPANSPTPKQTSTPAAASASPQASSSPVAEATPDDSFSPLGGKPATEAEKEYYAKKKEAEDLALAQNYEKAKPLFEELHAQSPEDVEVLFYLVLSYGATEEAPSRTSKAYQYAEKVLAVAPESREAGKARSYINTANLELPPKFKYGTDTMVSRGNWVLEQGATYKASADIAFHTSMTGRISQDDQSTLWETEASPATATGAEKLPKGTEVRVLGVKEFLYGLTSWRKPLKAKPDSYDKTMFDVSAMYVEVVSEGPLKGKQGWIVNQVDRYVADGPVAEGIDPWGAWISNRLNVPREADLATATPAK